jgi:hypothetical protein
MENGLGSAGGNNFFFLFALKRIGKNDITQILKACSYFHVRKVLVSNLNLNFLARSRLKCTDLQPQLTGQGNRMAKKRQA